MARSGWVAKADLVPLGIGLAVGLGLYEALHWKGFLLLFPWIGFSLSLGMAVRRHDRPGQLSLGRRLALLLILPALLLAVPLGNRENFQLEGVVLLILAGYFGKGVIHLAVAKVFGPFIWGRGFCGWACWFAAVLDWLPLDPSRRKPIPPGWKRLRYAALALSLALPLVLVLGYGFDVRGQFLGRMEPAWMFVSCAVYYALAAPLALAFADRRAFCKTLCPLPPLMHFQTMCARLGRRPTGEPCTGCGACDRACPMDVAPQSFIAAGQRVRSGECINCGECVRACPVGAIR
ncbi:MAG: 4Fe-4S dicluster domain-containing protein [Thermodesulfobacteriota bacterium]